MIEAARLEGTSMGRKMVATGHSAVVELREVVMVVEAAAGKEAGVLDWARAEYARREMGKRKMDIMLRRCNSSIFNILSLGQGLREVMVGGSLTSQSGERKAD
jgi:hypothetical protein